MDSKLYAKTQKRLDAKRAALLVEKWKGKEPVNVDEAKEYLRDLQVRWMVYSDLFDSWMAYGSEDPSLMPVKPEETFKEAKERLLHLLK